jgi:DNA polymerase
MILHGGIALNGSLPGFFDPGRCEVQGSAVIMNEIEDQFLNIVTQVRGHLELQRALGAAMVEVSVPTGTVTSPDPAPSVPVLRSEPRPEKPAAAPLPQGLAAVRQTLEGCTRCGLANGRRSIVFGEGKPDARLVFVGDAPGQEEDEQGKLFTGAAGQLLTDIIEKGMLIARADVYICSIVKCRPPDDRTPEPDEVQACEVILQRQLKAIKPGIIVALGDVAAQSLLKTAEGIATLRGRWHEYHGIPVMPTFHPAYLLRNPAGKRDVWADIKQVLARLDKLKKG